MAISVAGGVKPGKVIEVEQRHYQKIIVGKQKANTVVDSFDAQAENDANKLEIERQAIRLRVEQQAKSQQIYKAVSAQLTSTVNNAIEHQLASPELVLENSKLEESQILLIEQILASEPNLNRMRPLIANLSWLSRDLVTMINSPASKHRRPKTSDVQVTDLKLVLNYIGIENLRLLIPYFSLRNWLPSGNANLLWTTRKLWRYSMVTAIAAQALAQLHEKDVSLIYSSALMYQMGTAVILNNSISIYDKTWGGWLREASQERDKEVYDAVMATEFPAQKVYEQVLAHGHSLNWQLLELLEFKDSPLTNILKELDEAYYFSDLSVEAQIVAKASSFAKVYLLSEINMIEPAERRVMFDYYQFSEQEILRLKAQNFRKLDLL
ncbi:HDOD domain-containing protein [Shewanella sp. WXL01]|uniref:HDOD domain-containing protein n=1 Tax=Shewanella sp. WXL01 TaxID=2709721 RepID=UPI0014382C76|nr:HDOD domain-containing protein [Shewanella sp. WXL01]